MNESFQIIAILAAAQLALSITHTQRAAATDRHDRIFRSPLGRWPLELLWASCGLAALGCLGHIVSTDALSTLRLIGCAHLALLGFVAVWRSFAETRPASGVASRLAAAITAPGTLPAYLSLFVTTGADALGDGEQILLALALPTLSFAWNSLIALATAPAVTIRARRPRAVLPLRLQPVIGRG